MYVYLGSIVNNRPQKLPYDEVLEDFFKPPHGIQHQLLEIKQINKDFPWTLRTNKITKIKVWVSLTLFICIRPESTLLITKTYLYNFDPLKPHFYIVKLGFTGVYIIILITAQKHRLWVLVRTASARRF